MRVHFYLNKPVEAKEKHHYCYQTTRKGREKKKSLFELNIDVIFGKVNWFSCSFSFQSIKQRDDSLFAAQCKRRNTHFIDLFLEEKKIKWKNYRLRPKRKKPVSRRDNLLDKIDDDFRRQGIKSLSSSTCLKLLYKSAKSISPSLAFASYLRNNACIKSSFGSIR